MTEEVLKMAYMIRRNSDGLFSSGGMSPFFKKTGKVWRNMGALKNHLHQLRADRFPYHGCSIVVLKQVVTTEAVEQSDVSVLYAEMLAKKDKKDSEYRLKWKREELARHQQRVKELEAELKAREDAEK